VDHKKVAFDK